MFLAPETNLRKNLQILRHEFRFKRAASDITAIATTLNLLSNAFLRQLVFFKRNKIKNCH